MEKSRIAGLDKLFILLLFLSSGTPFNADIGVLAYISVIVWLMLLMNKRLLLGKRIFMGAVMILVLWTVQALLYGYSDMLVNILKNWMWLFMVFSYFTSYFDRTKQRMDFFIKCIITFAIISTVIFFLSILGVNLPTIMSKTYQYETVFYLGKVSPNPIYGLFGYRNYGIYWEPGLYQAYLNFLLIFLLYDKELFQGRRIPRYITIAFCVFLILTTGSTTGYVLCTINMILFLFRNRELPVLKILFIGMAVVVSLFVFEVLSEMITNKMTMGNSYKMRLTDMIKGFEVFKTKPILGYGIANDAYAQYTQGEFDSLRGNTNGLVSVLINFGIVGFLCYAYCFSRCASVLNRIYGVDLLSVFVFFIINMMSEPISLHQTIFMFLGIGLYNGLVNDHSRRSIFGIRRMRT